MFITVTLDPASLIEESGASSLVPIIHPVAVDFDLPIAIHKGYCTTRNPHPIYNFSSYHRLSPSYYAFVSALSSVSIPKIVQEALSHPGWRQAMIDVMQALETNQTWAFVPPPLGKSLAGCCWVFTIKVGPHGQIDWLKA